MSKQPDDRKTAALYRAAIRRRGEEPKADNQDPVDMQIADLDAQLRRIDKTGKKP